MSQTLHLSLNITQQETGRLYTARLAFMYVYLFKWQLQAMCSHLQSFTFSDIMRRPNVLVASNDAYSHRKGSTSHTWPPPEWRRVFVDVEISPNCKNVNAPVTYFPGFHPSENIRVHFTSVNQIPSWKRCVLGLSFSETSEWWCTQFHLIYIKTLHSLC